MSAAEVVIAGLRRAYGATVAVEKLDLEVAPGELLALLGPSGCGKTTSLRMMAGFVTPTAGTIRVGGRDITRLPPHRRNTGMVFQSYALFPHLTVAENIGFGLRRRGVAREEIKSRVDAMIGLLHLEGLAERMPRELSGGQQQRVAVGRALVIEPGVLLLDEPFSNLDAQLRETTRDELRRLQKAVGITTLFVTHDQAEALAMADRVAVMNAGRIEQVSRPAEIYERPATRFVASFIGRSNLFEGRARDSRLETGDGLVLRGHGGFAGADATALVRPEAVRVHAGHAPGENAFAGSVEAVTFQGASCVVQIVAGARRLLAEVPARATTGLEIGQAVTGRWGPEDVTFCGDAPP